MKPPLPRAALKRGKKKAAEGDSRPVVEIDLNAATPRPRKVVIDGGGQGGRDGQVPALDENLRSKRMSMTTRGVFAIPAGRLSVGSIGNNSPTTRAGKLHRARSGWEDDEVRIGHSGQIEFDLSF